MKESNEVSKKESSKHDETWALFEGTSFRE